MTKLDQRGDIAVAEIVVYIPILILSVILVIRNGFTRQAGWIYLVILSLIRIVGSCAAIASEYNTSSENLEITALSLESAGVSPLLLATLGFLRTICQDTLDRDPLIAKGLKLLPLAGTIALILAIVGGINSGTGSTQSSINQGLTLRHVGDIMFAVIFVLVVLLNGLCWANRGSIAYNRRVLLAGITGALPFVFVRVLYAVLSGFAPSLRGVNTDGQVVYVPSTSPLNTFYSLTGSWVAYLVMGVVPEFATMLVYITVGTRVRLERDSADAAYMLGRPSIQSDRESQEALARFQPRFEQPPNAYYAK